MKHAFILSTALVASTMLAGPANARAAEIDLDAPGALATLARDDPARYEVVAHVLDDASRITPAQARGLLHVRYAATDVELQPMLLVSYPAQRHLSFRLADVGYRATVLVREPVARETPAR